MTNTRELLTLSFLLVLFLNIYVYSKYIFKAWQPFHITGINCSSFCLKQIIHVSSCYVSSVLLLTSSIEEYKTILMRSNFANETKNLS